MEYEHSRLLKFLLPSENMLKQTLKYEYIKPTNIESEVPRVQELRETKNGNSFSDNSNTEKEENFVPVLTVKKEETSLTKGDFKLQKVLVTENVADEDNSNSADIINPVYSEIQSSVIPGPQPIREYPKDDENEENNEDNDSKNIKPKTKIPTIKPKNTVIQVQMQQKDASEEQDKTTHAPRRRSSIPKPRRKRISTSISEDVAKTNDNKYNHENNQRETTVIKPDEEFEKLFDEISDDKQVEEVAEKLLPKQIEDTEKLETSFEEIVQAYEENNILQPKKTKSKIPLSKQRSLHDDSIQKLVERRLSLRSMSLDESEKHDATQKRKIKERVNNEVSKIPVVQINENKPVPHPVEEHVRKSDSNDIQKGDKEENKTTQIKSNTTSIENNGTRTPTRSNNKHELKSENLNESKSDITIQPGDKNASRETNFNSKLPDSSRLVMDVFSKNDKSKENNMNENNYTSRERNTLETNKVKEANPSSINKEDTTLISKTNDSVTDAETAKDDEVPVSKGKVNNIINKIHSKDTKTKPVHKQEINIKPKNKSVFSKIALFERQSSNEPLTKNSKKEVYTVEEINLNDVENRKPKIIDSVIKSQPLRKNFIENNTSDPQITSSNHEMVEPKDDVKINPLNNDAPADMSNHDIKTISNHVAQDDKTPKLAKTEQTNKSPNVEESGKGDRIFEKAAKHLENDIQKSYAIESPDRKVQDINMIRSKSMVKLDADNTIVKGKVHQMIMRMNSSDRMEMRKKEVINVRERPRKKSVSEKIALFELSGRPVRADRTRETRTGSTRIALKRCMSSDELGAASGLDPHGPTRVAVKADLDRRKLTAVKLESPQTTTIQSIPKNDTATNNYLPKSLTEEEYAKRIEKLKNAAQVYGQIESMPNVTLKDGRKMPLISIGTALLDPRLIQPVIKAAIDLGYRAIDAAFIYGNEKEIGDAIKAKIDDGTVTREDLFIVNKLWNTFHREDLVVKACNASLAAMGLDYFDLYLVHSPMSFKEGKDVVPMIANVVQYSHHDYMDAWRGMEQLVSLGLAKSIGVSNFNATQITKLYEKARIKPVVNQVECHPYLTQQRLAQVCEERDIKLSCFGVLGSKGTPAALKTNLVPVIDDAQVETIAKELNATAAQVLLRYQIDSGHLIVVKASSAAHLGNNLGALDMKLTPAQLASLNNLNSNKRTYTFKGMGDTHRNYPFTAPF